MLRRAFEKLTTLIFPEALFVRDHMLDVESSLCRLIASKGYMGRTTRKYGGNHNLLCELSICDARGRMVTVCNMPVGTMIALHKQNGQHSQRTAHALFDHYIGELGGPQVKAQPQP